MDAYNGQNLEAAVLYALGRAPDANFSKNGIVNDALEWFCQGGDEGHAWSWRLTSTTLSLTADTNYVNLPADFEAMVSIRGSSSSYLFEQAPLDELLMRRSINSGGSNCYLYALNKQTGLAATDHFMWKMELWPTPAATASNVIVMTYRHVVPRLTSDSTDKPKVPPEMSGLLRLACMAFAQSNEEQQSGEYWRVLIPRMKSAIIRDGMRNERGGAMKNVLTNRGRINTLLPAAGFEP
jgi:hypothetical protein